MLRRHDVTTQRPYVRPGIIVLLLNAQHQTIYNIDNIDYADDMTTRYFHSSRPDETGERDYLKIFEIIVGKI